MKPPRSGYRGLLTRPREQTSLRRKVVLAALAIDLLLGEPAAAIHPVSWIGRAIGMLEQAAPAPALRRNLPYGLASVGSLLCLSGGIALLAERATRKLPGLAGLMVGALLLKPSFAVRMLCAAADEVEKSLRAGDLDAARCHLRSLVSRDVRALDESECAAAAIESLAENTTDSIAGPLLAYLCFGLPGAWAFRAMNTLDSRWGYHGRYELLGKAAARLDDVVAFVPARVSAILLIAGTAVAGGSAKGASRTVLREHSRTASPNAGWTMSAMAGGLGRRLEKKGQYALNAGAAPCTADDIRRAKRTVLAATAFGLSAFLLASYIPRPAGPARNSSP